MDVVAAIDGFKSIYSSLNSEQSLEFLNWVKENINDIIDKQIKSTGHNSDVVLESIREDVRSLLPLNGVTETEKICTPSVGPNADCDSLTTEHIDAFCFNNDDIDDLCDEGQMSRNYCIDCGLNRNADCDSLTTEHIDAFCFNGDDIDDLCDEGQMSRNYCIDCGSRNVRPLTFITHSASVKEIKYMFQHLLGDLRGKSVVDVGSRTGAILYGAYLMSEASCIVGVEIDPTFCQVQNQIITKYNLQDRVQVYQKDIQHCDQLIQQADVLILNNVFEFFMPLDTQKSIWNFLYQNVRKKGCFIVTVPSIKESLSAIELPLDLGSWLQEIPTGEIITSANLLLYGDRESEDSELTQIHLYQVK